MPLSRRIRQTWSTPAARMIPPSASWAPIRALREALQQLADRGTHHDLTPTMFFNGDDKAMYASMCEYLRGADAQVRGIASRALATPDSAASP